MRVTEIRIQVFKDLRRLVSYLVKITAKLRNPNRIYGIYVQRHSSCPLN